MDRGFIFDLGVSLLTGYDADGFQGVQVNVYGEQRSGMTAFENHHLYGFISRPLDPDSDGTGCTTLYAYKGSEGFAWYLNDPRLADKQPPVKKGGSAQYASDGSFASLDPETHTWTLYVPYEFDGSGVATKAHVVTVGQDGNGKPIVELSSGEGPAITILDKVTTVTNSPGTAYWQLDDSGTTIVGAVKLHGGAELGGEGALPLTKFPPLAAFATAVQAALAAIAGVPINSGAASGPVAAAAAALAALATAGPTLQTKGA